MLMETPRKARKERRKAMRDAYYARERKEAAYQASFYFLYDSFPC